ncbi:MAG: 4Fe-4S binding protein [Desulfuromonadales bacterium]
MPTELHLVYFSPTGTTRKIVEQIAAGLGAGSINRLDLTRTEVARDLHLAGGVAVIGVPVYAGRVPSIVLKRIGRLSADNVPAILVVLYGNREFEDALVELRDTALAKGFRPIAAGAFVGEHSYSTVKQPIAAGRPDAKDLSAARSFGKEVAVSLGSSDYITPPEVPGNISYRDRTPMGGIAPETTTARCILCGRCADVCPTFAVTVGKDVVTDAALCLMCCACTKACPASARQLNHPMVAARRAMLCQNFSARKEPILILPYVNIAS